MINQKIKFTCPHCGQNIEGSADVAGSVVECPVCTKQMQIPAAFALTPQPSKDTKPKRFKLGLIVGLFGGLAFIGLLALSFILIVGYAFLSSDLEHAADFQQKEPVREAYTAATSPEAVLRVMKEYDEYNRDPNNIILNDNPRTGFYLSAEKAVAVLSLIRYDDTPADFKEAWKKYLDSQTKSRDLLRDGADDLAVWIQTMSLSGSFNKVGEVAKGYGWVQPPSPLEEKLPLPDTR